MKALCLGAVLLLSSAVAAAQGVNPQRLVVGGVELHYIEQGQGEPLIMLHGGQGDYRAWSQHIEALSPRYRVISYSRRHHYPNKNPISADYSPLVDAKDLVEATAIAARIPMALKGTVEIRPVIEIPGLPAK